VYLLQAAVQAVFISRVMASIILVQAAVQLV
jgi:hypothetical protein